MPTSTAVLDANVGHSGDGLSAATVEAITFMLEQFGPVPIMDGAAVERMRGTSYVGVRQREADEMVKRGLAEVDNGMLRLVAKPV